HGKLGLFDAQGYFALGEPAPELEQLIGADLVEANLVEEAQQPGRGELGGLPVAVPHLGGAADELVAAGTFHAVDTHVSATDTNGVLRSPGARRVVLGGDQAMPRIKGRGNGSAQVDVAQAHDQVGGVEDNVPDRIDGSKAVHAADEFQVAGAPRSVG